MFKPRRPTGWRLLLLLAAIATIGCSERQPEATLKVEAPVGKPLENPASIEAWSESADAISSHVFELLRDQQTDEAIALTRRALELPRHPDFNPRFAWGHATKSLSRLLNGLVEAEKWDDVIKVGHWPDAKIGNELVESQRIRALALAHWKKHQFVFRELVLREELEASRKSLKRRIEKLEDWNEVNSPADLIELDWPFIKATRKHIESSLELLTELKTTKPTDESLAQMKQRCLDSVTKLAALNKSIAATASKSFDGLGLNRVAPDFHLQDAEGNTTVLAEKWAKGNILLVFYRGRGCLHCAMQLKDIAPRAQLFEDAGIEIIGVSADSQEQLGDALKAFNGRIPFQLLADPDQKVFQQYGLVIEDQDEPLHGVFLINQSGTIEWFDTGEEPYTDIRHMLEESQRLLKKGQ